MKILEVCTVAFSLTGIPIHIRNYYNELKKDNRIDIVSSNFDKKILSTMPLENGTTLYVLNRKKNPLNYMIQLRRLIKNNHYDVVHIHGNSATMSLELFACRNLPVLTVVHTHSIKYKAVHLNKILKPYLIKNADLCFAASHKAGIKLYGKRPYKVIINGIKIEKFYYNVDERKKIREKYSIRNDEILLGNIGTFNLPKNHAFLLTLAKKLPANYKFMLLGGGDRKEFEKKVKNERLLHRFIILSPVNDVYKFYSAFDMFLFPSKWEGLGMAAVEAQVSGLKCIVSNKVPHEVRITDTIEFLSIKNADLWLKSIINYDTSKSALSRTSEYSQLYDIKNCSVQVKKIYKKALMEKYEIKHKKRI